MNRRFLAGMAVVMLAFAVGGCSIPGFRVKGNYVEDARCDLDMKMIYVKGGTFQMGATSEQGYDVDKDEKPVHTVTLESYYIAECEVTQAQWCKVMGTSIYQQHGKVPASWSMYGVDDDNPMYYVNWYEAQEFCRRLSQMTGKHYTLPTEAQWEYAARGGKKSKGYRYSGSNDIGDVAWYDNFSYGQTNPVKQKQPNELGLYDMSGNVWEWCSDWRRDDYYWSSPQNDPIGPSSGRGRVLRGGSWNSTAKRCRASYRGYYDPSNRDNNLGFRVVCLP